MKRRYLYPREVLEAQSVFINTVAYERVRVHENAAWPLWIARLGARLSHTSPPSQNAITLGNWIFLSGDLSTDNGDLNDKFLNDMSWLAHELTHVWQYQYDGWIYLFEALRTQLKLGPDSYEYGWETGLIEARAQNKKLRDFNREQQGAIVQHYYYRYKQGLDTMAWEPFIHDLQVG
ncbi:MAG TPA: DUF4157 domain-containing protein [Anaerolineae bacterium]|nr:DUF4157 domain-containing protein [Anaerolineae bacterium]